MDALVRQRVVLLIVGSYLWIAPKDVWTDE